MKFEEKHDVELKEIFKKDDILKEIVSFLNTQGGTIYLGINNKKEVIGLKGNLYVIQLQISDLLTDSISPRCIEYVHQHLEEIDNKPVIVIDIKADSTHLYYIKKYGLSENGVYIRSGSGCKSLTPEEIQNRYIAALNIPEPDITEIPSHRKILTFQILKNYLTTHNYHYTDSTFEENLHLRTKNGEYNLMAEILGDTNDIVINIATFATTDKTKYLKRNEFGGKCLLLAMEQAKDYIEAINQISVDTTIRPRLEKPMFDMNAFKEAWYNACVHYKWSDGQNPGIYIYSDRLVIESFGECLKILQKNNF